MQDARIAKYRRLLIIYGSFFIRSFAFFLITPIFTENISSFEWGRVLATQALGSWIIILLDFGFTLSLSRKIAISGDDVASINSSVSAAFSAKLILLIPAALICLAASQFGILKSEYNLIVWGLIWAISQGLSPLWYYQATENLEKYSLIDIAVKLLYMIIAVLLFSRYPYGYLILSVQAVLNFMGNYLMIKWMINKIGPLNLSISGGFDALRQSFHLANFSLITSVYTTASVYIFSLLSPALAVALYGNADRLLRTAISLLGPINQIFLPRSSRAFKNSGKEGIKNLKHMLKVYAFLGMALFMIIWILSPYIIRIIFGEKYLESSEYLRIMLIILPMTCINTVIVYHFLIPNHLDSLVTKLYSYISVATLLSIFPLVKLFDTYGMIYAMLIPESIAMIFFSFYIFRWINSGRWAVKND
ncbi:oligosaccharide flippase family protein [Deinococcus aquaticus]|uniref:Oligosaccharide flippase family protein n=1 Tax=Deinococcus aquaticus TaxID=328692 RepID=A0ABY7V5V7_9DEIO|nr:oligosaccharide flippase family protein [Deinococcus aquaticus]WDA59272.1 oligosaccharide flippase family protein [Deinococcus aquaticus]